jgi:hypothetical protein
MTKLYRWVIGYIEEYDPILCMGFVAKTSEVYFEKKEECINHAKKYIDENLQDVAYRWIPCLLIQELQADWQ